MEGETPQEAAEGSGFPMSGVDWASAGGPNECAHGYAEGIACPGCDPEKFGEKWEGVMITYKERDAPGGEPYQRSVPGWKCKACGHQYGARGAPPKRCQCEIEAARKAAEVTALANQGVRIVVSETSVKLASVLRNRVPPGGGESARMVAAIQFLCEEIDELRATVQKLEGKLYERT